MYSFDPGSICPNCYEDTEIHPIVISVWQCWHCKTVWQLNRLGVIEIISRVQDSSQLPLQFDLDS